MSVPKTLFGTGYSIPDTDEVDWGDEATAFLGDVADGVEGSVQKLSGGNIVFVPSVDSDTITASETLTVTAAIMKVTGSGGAQSLDATTAIADGEFDGQRVTLEGQSNTNTVTVPDGANTALNGDAVLGQYHCLNLRWDSGDSVWKEEGRSH